MRVEQQNMELDTSVERVDEYKFEPIKGYPMLNWKGKRPFKGTKFFPAQLKEVHGDDVNGWLNKIFWGDNIQVMSHLLKEYRGKVDLVYIDPPFDSKADYKKKIKLKGKEVKNDTSMLEEKQYTDMWSNDEYLQFMYERLVLIRELLSDKGSVFVHVDWRKSHHIHSILDEVFGADNFKNEIIWHYSGWLKASSSQFARKHDSIFFYGKNNNTKINIIYESWVDKFSLKEIKDMEFSADKDGDFVIIEGEKNYLKKLLSDYIANRKQAIHRDEIGEYVWADGRNIAKRYLREVLLSGKSVDDVWNIRALTTSAVERVGYPTQKPEELIQRTLMAASKEGDLVFDCFMGSATTMAVAQKLGRKFIGADINLGAIQTSTKRLLKIVDEYKDIDLEEDEEYKACGFEVYNVNNYDVFRNPAQAKDLLIEALEIDPLGQGNYFDGMKDGQKVKIMPINRIATKKDVSDLINNLNYKEYEQLAKDNSKAKVDDILLVCMGHDPEMTPHFKKECQYNINIDIFDILKDGSELVFKRESEAKIVVDGSTLTVEKFYPNTLLEKLRQDGTEVEDYREMVESIMIDTNYDGSVFEPTIVDIPEKKELVSGEYELPEDSGTIAIKITDLLSETYFEEVSNG